MLIGFDGFPGAIEALFEQHRAFEAAAVADRGVRSGRHLFAQELDEAGRIPGRPKGMFEADAGGLGIRVDAVDQPIGARGFREAVEVFEQNIGPSKLECAGVWCVWIQRGDPFFQVIYEGLEHPRAFEQCFEARVRVVRGIGFGCELTEYLDRAAHVPEAIGEQ